MGGRVSKLALPQRIEFACWIGNQKYFNLFEP
jgi:hypothetical protein